MNENKNPKDVWKYKNLIKDLTIGKTNKAVKSLGKHKVNEQVCFMPLYRE